MLLLIFFNDNTTDSFKFKGKILSQKGNDSKASVKVMVQLQCPNNFWRSLAIQPINWEVNVILNWYQEWIAPSNALAAQATTFAITNTKLYVQVVILSP